jgi:hypothetical protein
MDVSRFASVIGIWAGVLALSVGGAVSLGAPAASAQGPVASPLTQSVTYHGLTIDVPGSWAVMTRQADQCDTAGPAAIYGPPPHAPWNFCPEFRKVAVVVTLGGGDRIAPVGPEHWRTIHGIKTAVSSQLTEGGGNVVVARFPGRGVWFSATAPPPSAPPSSGGGITVVRRILATVHTASRHLQQ